MIPPNSDSPVVEEIRQRGAIISQRFDNDPRKYLSYLKAAQAQHQNRLVSQITVVAAQSSPPR